MLLGMQCASLFPLHAVLQDADRNATPQGTCNVLIAGHCMPHCRRRTAYLALTRC